MTTVLITRPEPDTAHTAQQLEKRGYHCIKLALTKTTRLVQSLPDGNFHSVIATSAAAFRHADNSQLAHLYHLPLYCVGEKTSIAARKTGFQNIIAVYTDTPHLLTTASTLKQQHFLYLAGRVRRTKLETQLQQANHQVTTLTVYDTVLEHPNLHNDSLKQVDIVLLYSALSAIAFNKITQHLPKGVKIICLSQRIANHLAPALQKNTFICSSPHQKAVFNCLKSVQSSL